MKTWVKSLIVVIIILIIIAIPMISSYNNLVTLEQDVNVAESNIDTQLQRRSDLIPNLVNTVKGYASQEKDIFTEIADARSKLAGANNITEQANADSELSGALSRLLLVVENYPDLKSNQNFQDLSIQLEGTENRIEVTATIIKGVVKDKKGEPLVGVSVVIAGTATGTATDVNGNFSLPVKDSTGTLLLSLIHI